MLKITIISVGSKMPSWVIDGSQEYMKRLSDGVQLKLIEIPLLRRTKSSDIPRLMDKEAGLIKEAIPVGARLIALDIQGKSFSSESLASTIEQLQQVSSHFCFLIGGPEGLTKSTLSLCDDRWSLSPLTLPHPLVRIVLLEALYRALSIINHHPYHK